MLNVIEKSDHGENWTLKECKVHKVHLSDKWNRGAYLAPYSANDKE